MMFLRICKFCIILILLCVVNSFAQTMTKENNTPWSLRIAQSFLRMHPDSINYPNEGKSKKWNYEQGVMLDAMYQMWQHSGDSQYVRYIQKNLDHYIQSNGKINTYKYEEFQLDNIASGKALLQLYAATGESKYRIAADTLRRQLKEQPRTSDGGFWHKRIYPYQMWLDGMYMAEPFYCLYSKMTNDSAAFDDIAKQFILCAAHCYDSTSGLYFHGWDESKTQRWANPKTGCSPSLWGRSMGWYMLGLVNALDYIPQHHPQRKALIKILNDVCKNLLSVRDEKTKLWYLIVDKPGENGNYIESSASAMFAYVFAKGVNQRYLPHEFFDRAEETFQGLLNHLVSIDASGIIHLEHVCSVAGLGGNPYRDGSLAYYAGEPQRTDDFKGYGPFLMAAIEIEKSKDVKK
ncbi:MAG TPA: glycoside hydrolase family 88 protein [Bacteroidota bacterium]|nr:glycoside hydrolase family 88 protein [Bacteroidota bacterium]